MDNRIRLKVKNLLPSCEGWQVVPKKNVIELRQGHRTTVFCKISVRRSKNCLQFSITWGRLKISWWPFHSCTVFVAYLINSLRFSKVKFFTFQSPTSPIFRRKRKSKISGLENAMERGIRKILTFVKPKIASKIFGKIILRP